MKKIIFLLIDSLMPNILNDCLRHRTVPGLKFLMDRGKYWPNCVTVFPTMTATVDCSLVTGTYPDQHRIPGLIWYDPEAKEIVNYVNGWKCIRKLGLSKCAQHVLFNLNEKHLSAKVSTIFEELHRRGKTSASINAIVHRSVNRHAIRLPFLMDMSTGFRFRNGSTAGPDVMTLGAMVHSEINEKIPKPMRGYRQKCGINDAYAAQAAKTMIQSNQQPDFMLVYFPDNDHEVHKKNPAHAEEALIRVDRHIQEILYAFDSWEEAVNQCVFIVTSDHGQTRIGNEERFNIDLDLLLDSFRVLQLGEKVGSHHDLVVCNNERMAYVYPLRIDNLATIIEILSNESRIDFIAWKEEGQVTVKEAGSGRMMQYHPDGPYTDIYGSAWTITGEEAVVDLQIKEQEIRYGDYPDVLARLYGALYSQDVPMIVITARPRYEFKSRFYPVHLNGGSHGSLHKYDSDIPLIVAGTSHAVKEPPRLVDLKAYILELMDEG
ncbi:antitoxin [Paenibacillus dendritiformis]|uniref:alkaline phosphatase family protein n=1 Tax=Paenibacillus dendritiformis TaxID=130049 RepID=UPI0018CF4988|nr:alkaline phosphatase family protein [Paenibacillus dendritiformis]MBG9791973.1 antitoxin [Paenibacillus dendritiformis]